MRDLFNRQYYSIQYEQKKIYTKKEMRSRAPVSPAFAPTEYVVFPPARFSAMIRAASPPNLS